MKVKTLFLGFFIFSSGSFFSQPNYFSKVYTAQQSIQVYEVLKTSGDNFIIAGEIDGKGLIMKIDSSGNLLWNRNLGNSFGERFTSITKINDTTFATCGKILTTGNNLNILITTFNSIGTILLNKEIDLGFSEEATSIASTNDQGLVISAVIHGSGGAPFDKIGIIKLDSNTNLEWSKTYNYGTNADIPYTIKQVRDSNYMISGYTENFPPFDADASLIYLDKNGNIIWSNKYQVGNNWSKFKDFETDSLGITGLISTPDMKLCLARIDYGGNINWNRTYFGVYPSTTINDQYTKLTRTSDGKFLLTGIQNLIKTDSIGNLLWSTSPMMYNCRTIECDNKNLLMIGNGPVFGVTQSTTLNPHIGVERADSIGNFIICNQTPNSAGTVNDSIYPISINYSVMSSGTINNILVTMDTSPVSVNVGCVDFYGSNETNNYINLNPKFYPSPADNFISIKLNSLESHECESIKFFDAIGREISVQSEIYDETIHFNFSVLASGIYFVYLTHHNTQISQKLIINH